MKRNISKRVIAISALKDITGQRFGELEVLGYDHSEKCKGGKSTRTYWLCKCNCGNTKVVSKNCLRSGHTKSCGKCACTYDLDSYEYGVCTTRIGRQFIFDKNDYEKIKDVTWYFHHDYVVGRKPGTYDEMLYLHRVIMDLKESRYTNNLIVDHINHDKSDNRKQNLRIVTSCQNNTNRKRLSSNTSGCPGVCKRNDSGKWRASINVNKKKINLGTFSDFDEAVKVRKEAELKYYGQYSYDNSMKLHKGD